jgi:hypothetical protein
MSPARNCSLCGIQFVQRTGKPTLCVFTVAMASAVAYSDYRTAELGELE